MYPPQFAVEIGPFRDEMRRGLVLRRGLRKRAWAETKQLPSWTSEDGILGGAGGWILVGGGAPKLRVEPPAPLLPRPVGRSSSPVRSPHCPPQAPIQGASSHCAARELQQAGRGRAPETRKPQLHQPHLGRTIQRRLDTTTPPHHRHNAVATTTTTTGPRRLPQGSPIPPLYRPLIPQTETGRRAPSSRLPE